MKQRTFELLIFGVTLVSVASFLPLFENKIVGGSSIGVALAAVGCLFKIALRHGAGRSDKSP
jgi:hypothetical protein